MQSNLYTQQNFSKLRTLQSGCLNEYQLQTRLFIEFVVVKSVHNREIPLQHVQTTPHK